jgi:hypothetical protein
MFQFQSGTGTFLLVILLIVVILVFFGNKERNQRSLVIKQKITTLLFQQGGLSLTEISEHLSKRDHLAYVSDSFVIECLAELADAGKVSKSKKVLTHGGDALVGVWVYQLPQS